MRHDWTAGYRGRATVVYGHTPQAEALRHNNTINIDTGCVFGGKLTAYRYPEKEFAEIKALHTYYQPAKPFQSEAGRAAPYDNEARQDGIEFFKMTDEIWLSGQISSDYIIYFERAQMSDNK